MVVVRVLSTTTTRVVDWVVVVVLLMPGQVGRIGPGRGWWGARQR